MDELIRLQQFRKVQGRPVKLPRTLLKVLRKHGRDFYRVHKHMQDMVRILGRIYDHNREVLFPGGMALVPRDEWVEEMVKMIVKDAVTRGTGDH